VEPPKTKVSVLSWMPVGEKATSFNWALAVKLDPTRAERSEAASETGRLSMVMVPVESAGE